MDLNVVIGGILGGMILLYPITRLVRFLLFKLSLNSKQVSFLTSFITLLISAVLTFGINGFAGGFSFLALYIPSLIWFMFIDLQKGNQASKIIKFFKSAWYRYIFGTVTCLFLITIFSKILNAIPEYNDPYYISPLMAALIYTYFSFRKKSMSDDSVISVDTNIKNVDV